MSWLGCMRQCKKNGKQHHIQNQSKFLTWCLINGLECTVQNILISLFELHMKSKKQVKHQQNLSLKKGKAIITETPHLVTNILEDDNFSRKVLERKDWVSVSKTATCKILCNLQEFNAAFQEKHPNVNIGFSKFCAQRSKWFVLAGSLCLCMKRSSKCYVASRCNGQRLDIQNLIKLTLSCPKYLH